MKKIAFSLDSRSIARAIKELEAYRVEFDRKCLAFVQALTERGAEIAKLQVTSLGAVDTGELASSIKTIMYVDERKGVIFTDCPYAAFVEFGSGIVGSESPHPTLPWAYDVNAHGDAGWVYYDERQKRFRWTKGMPSRPFMLNTINELADEAVKVAREVFSSG